MDDPIYDTAEKVAEVVGERIHPWDTGQAFGAIHDVLTLISEGHPVVMPAIAYLLATQPEKVPGLECTAGNFNRRTPTHRLPELPDRGES